MLHSLWCTGVIYLFLCDLSVRGQWKVCGTYSIIKMVLAQMGRLSVSTNHSPSRCWVMAMEMGNESCCLECSSCNGYCDCWCFDSNVNPLHGIGSYKHYWIDVVMFWWVMRWQNHFETSSWLLVSHAFLPLFVSQTKKKGMGYDSRWKGGGSLQLNKEHRW